VVDDDDDEENDNYDASLFTNYCGLLQPAQSANY